MAQQRKSEKLNRNNNASGDCLRDPSNVGGQLAYCGPGGDGLLTDRDGRSRGRMDNRRRQTSRSRRTSRNSRRPVSSRRASDTWNDRLRQPVRIRVSFTEHLWNSFVLLHLCVRRYLHTKRFFTIKWRENNVIIYKQKKLKITVAGLCWGPGGTGPQILPTIFLIGSIVISLSRCCLPNDEGPGPQIFFPKTANEK